MYWKHARWPCSSQLLLCPILVTERWNWLENRGTQRFWHDADEQVYDRRVPHIGLLHVYDIHQVRGYWLPRKKRAFRADLKNWHSPWNWAWSQQVSLSLVVSAWCRYLPRNPNIWTTIGHKYSYPFRDTLMAISLLFCLSGPIQRHCQLLCFDVRFSSVRSSEIESLAVFLARWPVESYRTSYEILYNAFAFDIV